MRLYKLTDENGQTYCGTQWGPGVSHSGTGEGELCGPGWIHAYTHPLLAVLLNPIHADFKTPRLWEAEGEVEKEDFGLKVGCRTLTTAREIPLPVVTTEQRVRFGILCAKETTKDPAWHAWADKWLSGADRSSWAAEEAAWAAVEAAGWAARAAEAAEWAAEMAAAGAAGAAKAAERAARAAVAAEWAAARAGGINLAALAEKAVYG